VPAHGAEFFASHWHHWKILLSFFPSWPSLLSSAIRGELIAWQSLLILDDVSQNWPTKSRTKNGQSKIALRSILICFFSYWMCFLKWWWSRLSQSKNVRRYVRLQSSALYCRNSMKWKSRKDLWWKDYRLIDVIGKGSDISDSCYQVCCAVRFTCHDNESNWQPHNEYSILNDFIAFLDRKPQLVNDDDNLMVFARSCIPVRFATSEWPNAWTPI
jgi:hypothetical protein